MKILIIVEPERTDWYHYLKADTDSEYFLLWHEAQADIPPWVKNDSFFKGVYSWGTFLTANLLLKKIKPDRIVFFEIIDQRQIALLVAANAKKIKTFYLEHGAAGNKEAALKRADEIDFFIKTKRHYLWERFRGAFGKMLKSKLFYYSNLFKLSSFDSLWKYCKLPLSMLFNTPNKALASNIFVERMPYRSIVFNRPNFDQFQVYTGITEAKAVFTGVPIFDNYFLPESLANDYISYIDHPYLEENLLNWTPEHHKKIAQHLLQFALAKQVKLLVKLHPRSDLSLWRSYTFDPNFVEVVQAGDYTKQLLGSKLILGYSSSLLTGLLCAQKNIVNIAWHPIPKVFGVDFSKTGLCHFSSSPDDLETKFDNWMAHNLSVENESHYIDFLKNFNYPFDGKATERVIKTISE